MESLIHQGMDKNATSLQGDLH